MRFRPGRLFRRPGPLPRRMGPPAFGPRPGARMMAAALLGELDRAHRLLAEGRPAEAAPIFAELARQAEAHDMPQRAANLHLQAARCLFQMRDIPTAMGHARAGLQLFLNLGMMEKAGHAYARLLGGLRANGLAAEADALQREFGAQLGQAAEGMAAAPTPPEPEAPRGHLPAKCPSCSGPIRADEVEWIDEASAECPYCGGAVHLEA